MVKLAESSKPKRWALLVGINYYADEAIPNLRYCANDVRELGHLLLSRPQFGYSSQRMKSLVDQNTPETIVTRLDILDNLHTFAAATHRDDFLLFYFSGHGTLVENKPYLIIGDTRNDHLLPYTAIPLSTVKDIIRSAHARIKVILLDACHLGVQLGEKQMQSRDAFVKFAVEDAEGIAVLAASALNETAWETEKEGHGIFTFFVLEALRGLADRNKDGYISLTEVYEYVHKEIGAFRRNDSLARRQRPTLDFQGAGEIVLLTSQNAITVGPEDLEQATLNHLLRAMLSIAKTPDKDFFNRKSELAEIQTALASTDYVLHIQGMRCVGKTSFVYQARKLIAEKFAYDHPIICFTIDPYSLHSTADFAKELWSSLNSALIQEKLLTQFNNNYQYTTTADFCNRLDLIASEYSDFRFVAVVDEIDVISSRIEFIDIIGFVRHLIEQTDIPLLFFFTTTRGLPSIPGSPPREKLVILKPLDLAASVEMTQQILHGLITLEKPDLYKLYGLTGGHPFLINMLLLKLVKSRFWKNASSTLKADTWQQLINQVLAEPDIQKVFTDIFNVLETDEKAFLLDLANQAIESQKRKPGMKLKMSRELAAQGLVDYGLIEKNPQSAYHLRIGLFGNWLKSRRNVITTKAYPLPIGNTAKHDIPQDGLYLDIDTHSIYIDGRLQEKRVSSHVFLALVYLAHQNGRLVSREELYNQVYPGEILQPTDRSRLDSLISRMREAVDDRKRPYRFLETHPKQGVRLIARTSKQKE